MLRRKISKNEDAFSVVNLNDFTFLSKTVYGADGKSHPGLNVEMHCRITGYVATKIISIFPENIFKILFVKITPFIAAIHDIGKINPDFQKMIYSACSSENEKALEILKAINANSDRASRNSISFHAKVTQIVLEAESDGLKKYIAKIEGMHHGFRPYDATPVSECFYGGEQWTAARHELLKHLEAEFSNFENPWQDIKSWNEACVVGGLIIVADWIASGGKFATLKSAENLSIADIKTLAENAVMDAGFHKLSIKQKLSFEDIFGFSPRKVQKSFFDSVNGPGVYVLEAPMGVGKTESALYAAYKVLSKGFATGLYFALPTQLTSNKIYERVEKFLGKILEEKNRNDFLQLLHGTAWMETVFGEDGDFGKSWFDGKKRGILAPFAVGTVDQALMAVMDVKHSMVRSFGLAGKVVILDEIHSYDAYTGTLLNKLVESLVQSGCTVILLSATLTSRQKRDILNVKDFTSFNPAYPLISCRASLIKKSIIENCTDTVESSDLREVSVDAKTGNNVLLHFCDKRVYAAELALDKAFGGQQVLWIENTVQDAQDVFKILATRCGNEVECGLVHSRFEKLRRQENEDYWVSLYGSDGKSHRNEKGRILVGTQVLEQSIDIDADFLITAICPTDMLLQRMGRLWRHASNAEVRPVGAECACLIIAPSYESVLNKNHPFGNTGIVYSEYVLCRTYEVWKDKKNVSLPVDIRNLLEETYCDRNEEGLWKSYKDEMLEKKSMLESFARFAETKENTFDNTKTEAQVQTRYSEMETVNVLIIRSIEKVGEETKISFLSGNPVVISSSCRNISAKERMEICKTLMEHCVSVAEKNSPAYEKKVEIFKDYVYTGSDEEHPFRMALVGDDFMLLTFNKLPCGSEKDEKRIRFYYNRMLGYQVKKEEY